MSGHSSDRSGNPLAGSEMLEMLTFVRELTDEVEDSVALITTDPQLRMVMHLIQCHFEATTVTPTSLIAASRAPYATASRRMKEMLAAGMIEQRPRTATGKSFSMHPSDMLLEQWMQVSRRVRRLSEKRFGGQLAAQESKDYYFGDSYSAAQSVPPLRVRTEPLKIQGGLRVLGHGDPTFMVMDTLKRQFEQAIGTQIHQRSFSIDRLRGEALSNAARPTSRYDIIAVDLPWIGEFAEESVLMPLEDAMDVSRLDPADFHTAGWQASHWGGRPYGVPAQTTPELLFYRRDMLAEAGLAPPVTTDELLTAAKMLHRPRQGRFGIAWNAARGTALGHTFLMAMADFGQPVLDLPPIAGGFGTDHLATTDYHPTIDTDAGLRAAEYLLELLDYSPPNILSMSWYERIKPYAAGKVAIAFGYTLLAPYFELDATSPAHGQTGYLPHPVGPGASQIAPVGGYAIGIPANIAPERLSAAVEALCVFTSPEAQKMFVQNGSRTNPRYSVSADPEVRRTSPIFEAVDAMSWRDELQFWPRPPVPEIDGIIQICGEDIHDMLRGIVTPRQALASAQARCETLINARRN